MKLLRLVASLTFCSASFAALSAAGEISGQIIIAKTLTKKQVYLPAYQLRGVSSTLRQDDSGPVNEYSDMVVFLEGELPDAGSPIRAELIQRNQRFEPQLLVIPVGSTVSFPNADPIYHNVFSLSGAKRFDLGYYPEGHTRTIQFDLPGVVQIYCHLHPNMYAAVVVTPNEWYTRPAGDGSFALSRVPPGDYRLVVWHMHAGFFRKEVHVNANSPTNVDVAIPEHAVERPR
ncbi:MAG TPA: carboxypeptidase regulatory-like domain-containing protein [Candidatus Sulfotelmatobacter sp.]|nr:carboxypeptidase regulatory-like domain-containing protein [Candidatus Sulfotelmatobacter sp.]